MVILHCVFSTKQSERIMIVPDEIAETDSDDEWRLWLEQVFLFMEEIVAFAISRCDGGSRGTFVE